METYTPSVTVGRVACCECGVPIEPNPVNMCSACLRSRIDITEGIARTSTLYLCKFCNRYFVPPAAWMRAELESKELLSVCLKKLKPVLTQVRLTDAAFVWTEEHSKRVKVKLTVQKEVMHGTILQQSFIVEFSVHGQMCDECRRAEAKDFWRACVQVRQKAEFKKTLFYLEQLLLKHGAHAQSTGVKPVPTGIDFYYAKLQDARRLVDFLNTVLPCKYHYAQELVSHDTKNNTYDYKHTFCVEIVPVCRDNVCVLPKPVAQSLGQLSQIVICQRVSNVISLIDPRTLQMADVQGVAFWRTPFESLCTPKMLTQYYVVDVEMVDDLQRPSGHGFVSKKHKLADCWLVPADQVGKQGVDPICSRTHLAALLSPGDYCLGFDMRNCNANSRILDEMKEEDVPDIVIVRKVYDRTKRAQRRTWKLKRLVEDGNIIGRETDSMADEFERFKEDIEEDAVMREKINIYKDADKMARLQAGEMTEDEDDDLPPEMPTLAEMLDELDLSDVEMAEENAEKDDPQGGQSSGQ